MGIRSRIGPSSGARSRDTGGVHRVRSSFCGFLSSMHKALLVLRPEGQGILDRASSIEKPPHQTYSMKRIQLPSDTSELELSVQMEDLAEIRRWFAIESSRQPRLVPFWPGTDSDLSAAKETRRVPAGYSARGWGAGSRAWSHMGRTVTRTRLAVRGCHGTDWEALSGSRHRSEHRSILDYPSRMATTFTRLAVHLRRL
jgi:hypothetical protein